MSKPIPTVEQCYELWEIYHTPENVRRHISRVRDVAVWLAKHRQALGDTVDLALVEAGALLHDMLRLVGEGQIQLKHFREAPTYEDLEKWRELNTEYQGIGHAGAAAAELRKLGYPEVLCRLIVAHDFSRILDPEAGPQTLEEKIVYYADKRVLHDQVVTLQERFEDGRQRYPQFANAPDRELKRAAIYELERELFAGMGIDPDRINQSLKSIKSESL